MKIKLKNIGIIKDSVIELNGLTVITGDNSSGKTTVSKALYSLIDAVSDIRSKREADMVHYIYHQIMEIQYIMARFFSRYYSRYSDNISSFKKHISVYPYLLNLYKSKYNKKYLYKMLLEDRTESFLRTLKEELDHLSYDFDSERSINRSAEDPFSDLPDNLNQRRERSAFMRMTSLDAACEIVDSTLDTIIKADNINDYARTCINKTLRVEFSNQIQPVKYQDITSEIDLYEEGSHFFHVSIKDNNISGDEDFLFSDYLYKKAYFIDNPFVLDLPLYRRVETETDNETNNNIIDPNRITSHESKLSKAIRNSVQETVLESLVTDNKFKLIKEKINEVMSGDFEFSADNEVYISDGASLNITNLATGSKMFAILKILLEKGEIDNSTLLILDEPEAHLHPGWQNKFAEIIVMAVKELGVNILLTTHSPNFVLAVDAYMRKYDIAEKTNFYHTSHIDDYFVEYKNVNDDIGLIYDDFTKYLAEVKGLRDTYFYGTGDEDDE